MPDPFEQLLLKFGIDLGPVKNSAAELKSILDAINASSVAGAKVTATAQTAAFKEVSAAASASIAVTKAGIVEELAKAAVIKTQTAEYQKQIAQQSVSVAESKAAEAAEAAKLAVLRTQTAEYNKQNAAKRAGHGGGGGKPPEHGHGEGHHSTFGNVRNSIGKGLFGAGIGGQLITGAIAGAGAGVLAESLVEGIEKIVEKIKEGVVESSRLAQLMTEFGNVTQRAGVDADEMMEKMQRGTDGLVSKFQLMKTATVGLKSPYHLSEEEITSTVSAVVKLSDVYKNVDEGMSAFSTALQTGRTRALAYATGLTDTALKLQGLPPILDEVAKSSAQVHHEFALIRAKAQEMGDIPSTFEDVARQFKIMSEDTLESFGAGLTRSNGVQYLLHELSGGIETLAALEKKAEEFGDKIGDAFGIAGVAAQQLIEVVQSLFSLVQDLFNLFALGNDGLSLFGKALIGVSTLLQIIIGFGRTLIVVAHAAVLELTDLLTLNFTQFAKDFKEAGIEIQSVWNESVFKPASEANAKMAAFEETLKKIRAGHGKNRPAPDAAPDAQDNTKERNALIAAQSKLNDAIIELEEKRRSIVLDSRKQTLDTEKELMDEEYQYGKLTLDKHVSDLNDAARKEKELADAQAQSERTAALAKIEEQRRVLKENTGYSVFPEVAKKQNEAFDAQAQSVNDDYIKKTQASTAKLQSVVHKNTQLSVKDTIDVTKEQIDQQLTKTKEGIQQTQTLLEDGFRQGTVDANDYLVTRLSLIGQTLDAELKAQDALYQQTEEKSAAGEEKLKDRKLKIIADAQDQQLQLQLQQDDKQVQAVNNKYQGRQGALEGVLNNVVDNQGKVGGTTQRDVEYQAQVLLDHLNSYYVDAKKTLDLIQPGTTAWYQQYTVLSNIADKQREITEQVQKQRELNSVQSKAGSVFGVLGQGVSSAFHSNFGQDLGETVQRSAKYLTDISGLADKFKGVVKKSPEQQALDATMTAASASFTAAKPPVDAVALGMTALASALDSATQAAIAFANAKSGNPADPYAVANPSHDPNTSVDVSSGGGDYGNSSSSGSPSSKQNDSAKNATDKLISMASAVVGFVDTVAHAKSGVSGAVGGGLSGAGLGNQIAGPLGAIVGGAIGAITGGILGRKNAEVTKHIHEFQTSEKDIMTAFANNADNLQQTITSLATLVAQIQATQSSSKKGGSQYQDLIDKYNDQITQLRTQQLQIITNMHEMAAVANAPLNDQSFLSDIQGIIKQFMQFEGAAQTTQDLADAYSYLNQAIQNYSETQSQQLLTDNAQAIQDALQLNDLLYQRTTIMQDYANQVQGILSAGVLTRTQTRAQTAGQQIQQLQVAHDRQMQDLNEQVDAATYKVNAETTIFGLAQTRIGLENQLLAAQNAQTNLDMQRIQALQVLVNALQSGNLSAIPGLTNVVNAFPGITNTAVGLGSDPDATYAAMTAALTDFQQKNVFGGLGGGIQASFVAQMQGIINNYAATHSNLGGTTVSAASSLNASLAAMYAKRASQGYATYRAANL